LSAQLRHKWIKTKPQGALGLLEDLVVNGPIHRTDVDPEPLNGVSLR
jgi:hypothetical protein